MANPVIDIQGALQRLLKQAPGLGQRPRLNHIGDQISANLFNGMQQAAAEGSLYYHVNGGTRDSGVNISTTTNVTYSATNAILIVDNTNDPSNPNSPDVILDALKIKIDAIAGGSPTFWQWYHALDKGTRYSSGATAAGVNALTQNARGEAPPGVNVYSGQLVATAATAAVHDVGTNLMNNGAAVAQAVVNLVYGGQERPAGVFTTPTTGVQQSTQYAPAIVIPPGYSYVLNEYWTGRTTTALTGEISLSLIVR